MCGHRSKVYERDFYIQDACNPIKRCTVYARGAHGLPTSGGVVRMQSSLKMNCSKPGVNKSRAVYSKLLVKLCLVS